MMRDAGKNWKVRRPLVSVSFDDLSIDTWCSYVAYPSAVQFSNKFSKNWNEIGAQPLSVLNSRGEDALLIRLRAGLR